MGNKVGRPLIFNCVEELEEKIKKYYEKCNEEDKPLTLSGLAYWLGIDRKTLYNYSERDEFFPTIKKAKDAIQADMEERALSGKSNATFSIFALKNNYGWIDKQEVISENLNTNKNIDLSYLTDEQLNKILSSE